MWRLVCWGATLCLLFLCCTGAPSKKKVAPHPPNHEGHEDDVSHDGWSAPTDQGGYFEQVVNLGGRQIPLSQIEAIINQSKPIYDNDIVCAGQELGVCCPMYCCSLMSTAHSHNLTLQAPDLKKQTATLEGNFEIFSHQDDLDEEGLFGAMLWKDFPMDVWGGWTLVVKFNKPVFDLHSWNARIIGIQDGATVYYFGPLAWNKDLRKGMHRLMMQGQTTPIKVDNLPLTATGALHYSPPAHGQRLNGPELKYHAEARPVPAPLPTPGERFNLAEVLQLSILFYEAQRSGRLPETNRIPWRASSGLDDKGEEGEDLTGGWYDAGDHTKLGMPMAFSTTMLLWGLIRYPESYAMTGQLDDMLDCVKWPLDYFIKAHTKPKEFYVQISDIVDHCYWTAPERQTYRRKAYKVTCKNPGSQPVMDAVAAMAAGSIAFKDKDQAYAAILLKHAQELYDFADQCYGDYVKDGRIPAGTMYNDGGYYWDEHAWGGMWLYYATGQAKYLDKVKKQYDQCCSKWQAVGQADQGLSWANKAMGVNLLLKQLEGGKEYDAIINSHLESWMEELYHTPKGLAYLNQWGANRYAANAAWVALVAADLGLKPEEYRTWGISQIYYTLGDCCRDEKGQVTTSHLVGFGPQWPQSYHHRGSTCNGDECSCTAGPNVHTLWGALTGGPDRNDTISADGCPDFIHLEVATDFNAGFTSSVAAIKQLSIDGILDNYQNGGIVAGQK